MGQNNLAGRVKFIHKITTLLNFSINTTQLDKIIKPLVENRFNFI